jgi:CRP-like cAMP-binding protein
VGSGEDIKAAAPFAKLDAHLLEQIAEAGATRTLSPGTVVIDQGDPPTTFAVLVQGAAEVEIDGVVVATMGAGECIGEMAILDEEPHGARVTITQPSVVLDVPAPRFADLMATYPELRHRVTKMLTSRLRASSQARSREGPVSDDDLPDPLEGLTPAERRVAEQVAAGLSNAAIADALFVSRHTVETHLKRIYAKLALASRVELAGTVLRRRE